VGEALGVAVALTVGLMDSVAVADHVRLAVAEIVGVRLGVMLGLMVRVALIVGLMAGVVMK
jgi:hypothetical protein